MFKFRTLDGKISKTVVIGWLQILSAVILAIAEFVKQGDFSTYAALILFNGVLMIVLRNFTDSPLQ